MGARIWAPPPLTLAGEASWPQSGRPALVRRARPGVASCLPATVSLPGATVSSTSARQAASLQPQ